MPERQKLRFVVLCEGEKDYHFVRGYLIKKFGKRHVAITRRDVPVGSGSGEQHVRRLFPEELKARRTKPAGENLWLVVISDADSLTVSERVKTLENAASDAGITPPSEEDKVLVFCPKRNIETWMHWAYGERVDESKDYKNQYKNNGGKACGEKAQERCFAVNNISHLNGGLKEACEQVARIQ